ncbi:cytochrome P450 [Streptomyces sp. NPDC051172]|uniref:cytochrome P450 family protein n=1 Tax=Streptomyces sp. NPDC051172 TaxID=3155796 RepID=UPI003417030B
MTVDDTGEIDLITLMTSPDRHALYARLRARGPVVRCRFIDGTPMWLVTRHAEALQVLADPRLVNDSAKHGRINVAAANALPEDLGRYFTGNMLDRDPPEHTRLRKLVARVFTARAVRELRPVVEELTGGLLDAGTSAQRFDLVTGLAEPLPVRVICRLFGVPEHQWDLWATHSRALTSMDEGVTDAARGLVGLALELITDKRRTPGDDLVSELVRLNDAESDRLSDDELVTTVITLLGTGHESTVQLVGNGMYALVAHPDQADLLRADPDRIPAAVEEFLRFFTPFELSGLRFTDAPVEIGGVLIPEGEAVQVALAAADRDPRAFAHADRLDVTRTDAGRHLALGHGIHYCIGAALARTQAETAVREVLRRFPRLRPAVPLSEVPWRHTFVSGPASLPVEAAVAQGAAR